LRFSRSQQLDAVGAHVDPADRVVGSRSIDLDGRTGTRHREFAPI